MFTFEIRPDDGEPFELRATSRDVYVWERSGKGRTLQRFTEEFSLTDCYAIAHIAARRQQLHTGSLEDFASSCDLDFREDETEPDPSRPGRSPGA